jgi:meso-butanediol dehydrogenase / (S,S)-butanediol dehydrogenase / diacetyl reductase
MPTRPGSDAPVAIITGAGSGIGAAAARRLADDGWQTVLTGRRREPLEEVAGAQATVLPGDVREADHVHALIAAAIERRGRLDGLVLNAGVTVAGAVGETSDEDWGRVIETNLTAPFKLVRAALPHLIRSRGAIVGVGSIAAQVSGPELAAYGVSKAGLVRLIQSVAVDYGGRGVRANVVNPGWTRSEMADAELGELVGELGADLESVYREITRYVPSGRPGTAGEIAAAIAWLLGPESAYVNGAVLTVDGGTSIVDVGTIAFGDRPGADGR